MDIKDVSDQNELAAFFQKMKQIAEKASQRKGQLVRDHPPSEQLISDFMMKTKMRTLSIHSRPVENTIATSQIPLPYAACNRSSTDLDSIPIADMRLETHHRGKKTLLRVRTPPDRMTAVMGVVEDEQATAVLLQLYFQADESVVPAAEILQPNRVCILKEPFFKCATDGSYSLRVDHLSDIIWLGSGDERIPSKWRMPTSKLSSMSNKIRAQGNKAAQMQSWAAAQRLYSSAIQTAETPEEKRLAYLNRALTNLRLGLPEQALHDATRGADATSPSEKALFREARALYELGHFELCLVTLQTLSKSYPKNTAAELEMDRVKTRLHEQRTGKYAFEKMYQQARQTPPLIDCATFSAPIEVRSSPGRGRGLFTTVPVSAGSLLACEKAFAYSYAGEDQPARMSILMNLGTNKASMGAQAHLLTQIAQKLYHSPEALQLYNELYRGDYAATQVSQSDGYPVVDSFLIEHIRALNSFGAPRTSLESFSDLVSGTRSAKGEGMQSFTTCGIWLLASRVNHSCVGNCRRSFIGDMQIIRATRDLEAGTELFFGYRAPKLLESYDQVQKGLSKWGFACGCELCVSRKATSKASLEKRKALFEDLKKVLESPRLTNTSQAERLLEQLEKTYPTADMHAVRLELWDPYFALGADALSTANLANAVKNIVRGLETLGFSIIACPPLGVATVPRLEVKQWGTSMDCTPWAFLNLAKVYERISPELCVTARKYAKIAYRMVVGEEETMYEEFSQFA